MPAPLIHSRLLPRKGLTALVRDPIGRLHPVLDMAAPPLPCGVIDTFDQRLLSRHKLLISAAGQLDLVTRVGEASQPGHAGFVTDLPPGPVKAMLQDLPSQRSLCTLAEGTLQAGMLRFEDDEGKTQVRARLWLLSLEGESAVLVTLQPMRGYDKAAEALGQKLADCGARPLSRDRVCDMLLPNLPVSKADMEVPPDALAGEAATAILRSQFEVALAHVPGICADVDSEFLHQYRVALRKMRLVVRLFCKVWRADQSEVLKQQLSEMMQPSGTQRDLDVLLLARSDLEDRLPPALLPGLADLFSLIAAERASAHATLCKVLKSDTHRAAIESISRILQRDWLGQGKAADRLFRGVAEDLIHATDIRVDPSLPDAAIHRLRLKIKARRYLMDSIGADSRPLRRLQEQLGRFNDLCVQSAHLQALLARHPEASHGTAQAVGALTTILHAEAQLARAEAVAHSRVLS